MEKECTTCHTVKPVSEFDPDERYKSGYRSQCHECRYAKLQESRLRGHLLRAYGITLEAYEEMLDRQGGTCAICHREETRPARPNGRLTSKSVTRLSVDHCHETGVVRGLLCQRCNIAISHMNDDPAVLRRAAEYLEMQR